MRGDRREGDGVVGLGGARGVQPDADAHPVFFGIDVAGLREKEEGRREFRRGVVDVVAQDLHRRLGDAGLEQGGVVPKRTREEVVESDVLEVLERDGWGGAGDAF